MRSHGATVSRLRAAHALSACYLALSQPLLAELVLERFRDSRDRLRELSVAERALAYPIVAQAATTPDVVVTGEMLLEILRELESLGASDDASVNQDLIAARVAAVRRRIGG